jgi:hypothetical protein
MSFIDWAVRKAFFELTHRVMATMSHSAVPDARAFVWFSA